MLFDVAISHANADLQLHLNWCKSKAYNDALFSKGFMENYGWCEIIGTNGFFKGDDFLLGFLMLGPHQYYRDYFHPGERWTSCGQAALTCQFHCVTVKNGTGDTEMVASLVHISEGFSEVDDPLLA